MLKNKSKQNEKIYHPYQNTGIGEDITCVLESLIPY